MTVHVNVVIVVSRSGGRKPFEDTTVAVLGYVIARIVVLVNGDLNSKAQEKC